MSSEAR